MHTIFSENNIEYDGSQLRSHWIFDSFGILGDAAAAFIGRCDVRPEHMVDVEDLREGDRIFSEEMLHFIVEHFDIPLTEAVLRQRILISIVKEAVDNRGDVKVKRKGSDLFERDCKLTVSIATKSPVSGLIHAGINIRSDNTPVKTKGLADYGMNPAEFAAEVLRRYEEETELVSRSLSKARGVR